MPFAIFSRLLAALNALWLVGTAICIVRFDDTQRLPKWSKLYSRHQLEVAGQVSDPGTGAPSTSIFNRLVASYS